jgi:hypothetical protein
MEWRQGNAGYDPGEAESSVIRLIMTSFADGYAARKMPRSPVAAGHFALVVNRKSAR